MIESGVIIDHKGLPIHWHMPTGRTSVSLPDSQLLWDEFWRYREYIAGFAHSHPGSGVPGPSYEDVTTFSAIERALGKKLQWWITSSDRVALVTWSGPGKLDYTGGELLKTPPWVPELRHLSNYYNKENGNDDSIDDNNPG